MNKLLIVLFAAACSFSLQAATIVYDFEGGASGFVTESAQTWSWTTATGTNGTKVFQTTFGSNGISTPATTLVPFTVAGTNFNISVDVNILNSSNTTIALLALASSGTGFNGSSAGTASAYRFYYATGSGAAGAQQYNIGANSSTLGSTTEKLTFNSARTYHLTLEGTYLDNGSKLQMTYTVNDGVNAPLVFTYMDSDNLLAGNYFGFQIYNNAAGTVKVQFDNLNVTTIPEPATYALLGLGIVALTLFRHKRSNLTQTRNHSRE